MRTSIPAAKPSGGISMPSDSREALQRRFKASPFAAIRELEVSFHEGVITLRGVVPTYYTRQIALMLAKQPLSDGESVIHDRIQVTRTENGNG